MKLVNVIMILGVLFLTGCAATQDISEFDEIPPHTVCIAEHQAVREGVLDALEEGFRSHGADVKVIKGSYEKKHNMWHPQIYTSDLEGCDAIAFYVANWRWDISMYMCFANIWVTDTAMSEKIAQATYQTGGGPDKWINARKKLLELVDEMYKSVAQQQTVVTQNIPASVEKASPTLPPISENSEPVLVLQRLKVLYDRGLIDESEYATKKKEVLDTL